jgi:hypothetical protein
MGHGGPTIRKKLVKVTHGVAFFVGELPALLSYPTDPASLFFR